MIDFESVSFSYGEKKIISDFSMHIASGERVCLFGPSGSGKSTILRLIMGLERQDLGSINVESQSISAVFQEDRLLPFRTVLENVSMFSSEQKAKILLAELGLGDDMVKYPSEFSGGMARRAAIARALAVEGDIYIFDEPFDGLDEDNIKTAIELISGMTAGKTVILVSHNTADAEALGCRLIGIEKGTG